ncbi:hypothetical protein [Ferrimicrobium acidiphilum]|uniref:hypothetical protein n=1 Tax=Ferrimicrobium acidiphilum TaxID=121039 RepID=UPI0023F31360|nr:hypothetical protein [Ferrimicrobium acidiphilum]
MRGLPGVSAGCTARNGAVFGEGAADVGVFIGCKLFDDLGKLGEGGVAGEGGTDMMVLVGGEGLDGFGSGCNCGVVGEVGADVPVFVGGELPHPLGP